MPWAALCRMIEPFYPKPGNGRPQIGIERMLRLYFLQHWFNLSDPAIEEALYDLLAMRSIVGSTSAASRYRTRRRCAASATRSKSTISAGGCLTRSNGTWPNGG